MKIPAAIELIRQRQYKPGWKFDAEQLDNFEGAIKIMVSYEAPDWNDPNLANRDSHADFVMFCTPECNDLDIQRKLLRIIATIDAHEAREALRDSATGQADFHPHTQRGIYNWGEPDHDMTFGVV